MISNQVHIRYTSTKCFNTEKDWFRYADNGTSNNGHDAWDIKELNYYKSDEIFYAKLWLKNLTSLIMILHFHSYNTAYK